MLNKKINFVSAVVALIIMPLASYADPFADLDAETNSSFNNSSAQWQQKRATDAFSDMEKEMQRFNGTAQPVIQPPREPVKPKVVERVQPAPQPIVIVIPERVREPAPARAQAPVPVVAPQPVVSAKPAPVKKAASSDQTVRTRGYVFELHACTKNGSSVNCELTVTSKKQDKTLKFHRDTRLFDNLGNEYGVSRIQIANSNRNLRRYGSISKQLISEIATKVNITFENIAGDATAVAKLNIVAHSQSNWFHVTYRSFDLASES